MYPNTLKIHIVCVPYIQQIYFFQYSFSDFINFSYFFLKKHEIRVKPGHLQQIKKKLWVCHFFIKLHLYLTGNTNTLWVFFFIFFFSVHKQS